MICSQTQNRAGEPAAGKGFAISGLRIGPQWFCRLRACRIKGRRVCSMREMFRIGVPILIHLPGTSCRYNPIETAKAHRGARGGEQSSAGTVRRVRVGAYGPAGKRIAPSMPDGPFPVRAMIRGKRSGACDRPPRKGTWPEAWPYLRTRANRRKRSQDCQIAKKRRILKLLETCAV